MTKTRQNKDMIDRIGATYAKIKIEMSWPIGQDAVYHEKKT